MQPHQYHIRLSSREKQTLRQLKRAGKTERRLADRARIILWTAKCVAVADIAQRLDIHRDTVIAWRQRFVAGQQAGLDTVDCVRDRPRSGRPRQYTAPQVAEIKAIACEQPAVRKLPLSRFSLAEITLWIQHAAGQLPKLDPGPYPDACQLAQPDRDLLLDLATEGPDTSRFSRPGSAQQPGPGFSSTLQQDRQAIQLEVHPGEAARTLAYRDQHEVGEFMKSRPRPACEMVWCGARKGRWRISGTSPGNMPATEKMRVTSSASVGVMRGTPKVLRAASAQGASCPIPAVPTSS